MAIANDSKKATRQQKVLILKCFNCFTGGCCNSATVDFSLLLLAPWLSRTGTPSSMMLSGDSTGGLGRCIIESTKSEIVGTSLVGAIFKHRATKTRWHTPRSSSTNGTSRSGRRGASSHGLSRSVEAGSAAVPCAADLNLPTQAAMPVSPRLHASARPLRAPRFADALPRIWARA